MIGLVELGGRGLVGAALERSGERVTVFSGPEKVLAALREGDLDGLIVEAPLLDARVRELLALARTRTVTTLFVSRERSVSAAVEALRTGADDYLCSPFEYESLQPALSRLLDASSARVGSQSEVNPLVTQDAELRASVELARSVAPSDATILIEGESGTGKELLAGLIHRFSPRRERELVSVNCAALPSGLLESELFGHEKGAFTGAVGRALGKFEIAHQTTLLLDEIGELEFSLQAKLLRVLQEREVQRLGAPRPVRVDFRLIATTNRELGAEVAAGRFRQDLFYRLHVLPIRLTPLRDRPGDVPILIHHFLRRHARRSRDLPLIPSEIMEILRRNPWPGNVREVQNLVERLVLTRPGQIVRPEDLGVGSLSCALEGRGSPPEVQDLRTLREMERWMIVETLKRLKGNRTHAARELGISLRTLRNKIHEHQIFDPGTLPRTGTARAPKSGRTGQISPG